MATRKKKALKKEYKKCWESLKKANKKLRRPVNKSEWMAQIEKDKVKNKRGSTPRISPAMIKVLIKRKYLKKSGNRFSARGKIKIEETKQIRWREFEQDLVKFLYKLGFDPKSIKTTDETKKIFKTEIDVCGGFEERLFFIECKFQGKRKKNSLDAAINKIHRRRNSIIRNAKNHPFYSRYSKFEFVIATKNYAFIKSDLKNMKKSKIHSWDEMLIEYYLDLNKNIGEYAVYNLLGEMGIKPRSEDFFRIPASKVIIRFERKKYKLFYFFTDPKKLLPYAFVARRERGDKEFYQRVIKSDRLSKIKNFIDGGGFFPNNIIISIEEKPTFISLNKKFFEEENDNHVDIGILRFPKTFLSCRIIDGQHRLYGFSKSQLSPSIPIIAFDRLSKIEQMKFFVDINWKQKSVDSNLIWDLQGELSPSSPQGIISNSVRDLNDLLPFFDKKKGVRKYLIYIPFMGVKKGPSINMSAFCSSIKKAGLCNKKIRNTTRSNPLFASGFRSTSKNVANALSKYLTIIDSIFTDELKEFVFGTEGGMSVMIYFYQRLMTRFNGKPQINESFKYLNSLKKYLSKEDINEIKARCTSEDQKDSLVDEFIEEVATDLNDTTLLKSIQTAEYKEDIDNLERQIGKFLNKVFNKLSNDWLKERLDPDLREKAIDRLQKKIPEDKRTEIHEFLTLGELKNTLFFSNNWKELKKYFVKIKGEKNPNPDKFNNEDLFKGAMQFLIEYRNPPAHGEKIKPTKENLQQIKIYVSKISACMN